jgi:hypothetical protein
MRRHMETAKNLAATLVALALHPDPAGFNSITTSGALRQFFNRRVSHPHSALPSLSLLVCSLAQTCRFGKTKGSLTFPFPLLLLPFL